MATLHLEDVTHYVETHIASFHQKRVQSVDGLQLEKILKRKNPYLFRAKNVHTPEQLVRAIVDAHISSHEETIFGDWLEGLAIFINAKVFGGMKSGISGIDLEFQDEGIRYIVSIKSGPNWGNSSQVKKMRTDFTTAQKALRTSNSQLHVVAVNGCCYGRDNNPDKGGYFKYCGQRFWEFISGDANLYTDIIKPLGHKAHERNEEFMQSYHRLITRMVRDFSNKYTTQDGNIHWEKIIMMNSAQ